MLTYYHLYIIYIPSAYIVNVRSFQYKMTITNHKVPKWTALIQYFLFIFLSLSDVNIKQVMFLSL